jgi:hypothetical protein
MAERLVKNLFLLSARHERFTQGLTNFVAVHEVFCGM